MAIHVRLRRTGYFWAARREEGVAPTCRDALVRLRSIKEGNVVARKWPKSVGARWCHAFGCICHSNLPPPCHSSVPPQKSMKYPHLRPVLPGEVLLDTSKALIRHFSALATVIPARMSRYRVDPSGSFLSEGAHAVCLIQWPFYRRGSDKLSESPWLSDGAFLLQEERNSKRMVVSLLKYSQFTCIITTGIVFRNRFAGVVASPRLAEMHAELKIDIAIG